MDPKKFIGKVYDHFRILEPLGKGGMGMVFKALNTRLDKIVAIKMIAPSMAMNQRLLNRFKSEARALARLENPHIVRIIDLREDNDQWFIVMEYIEGQNLTDILNRGKPLHIKEALRITRQILLALQHAHSANIIHRDIKPSNILITSEGMVKVMDFGLAKIQTESVTHTQHSTIGGTLFYMSPEQVKSLKETDHRTDIYSLGITLYQMLTCKLPFELNQSDFDIRETIVRKDYPPPSTFNPYLPEIIDAFVMKALAKAPEDRFQSAVEMMRQLDKITLEIGHRLDLLQPLDDELLGEINYLHYDFGQSDTFSADEIASEPAASTFVDETEVQPQVDNESRETEDTALFEPIVPESSLRNKLAYIVIPLLVLGIIFALMFFRQPSSSKQQTAVPLSTLSIKGQPEYARIFIDGRLRASAPVDSLLLSPGEHHLRIEETGYQPWDTVLAAKSGWHVLLRYTLKHEQVKKTSASLRNTATSVASAFVKPGHRSIPLLFVSQPEGAVLEIDGEKQGRTPLILTLTPGRRLQLSLRKEGYLPKQEILHIKDDMPYKLIYTLEPAMAEIQLHTNIDRGTIFIDGEKFGPIINKQARIETLPGKHILRIIAPDFQDYTQEIELAAGADRKLEANLLPRTGTLSVLALPWADFTLDNTLWKSGTNVKQRKELAAGMHTLKVSHISGVCEQEIRIYPDSPTEWQFHFSSTSDLRILAFAANGQPLHAEIMVDGQDSGQFTPASITLPQGEHSIEVRKSGYQLMGGPQKVRICPECSIKIIFTLREEKK